MRNVNELFDPICRSGTFLTRLLALFLFSTSVCFATFITFEFKGEIKEVDSPLASVFSVGDPFTLTYTFDIYSPKQEIGLGHFQFNDAIKKMTFSSEGYTAFANNGNVEQDFEEEKRVIANSSGPVIGPMAAYFKPLSISFYWLFGPDPWKFVSEINSLPNTILENPQFVPDLTPVYLLDLRKTLYDADGNIVYQHPDFGTPIGDLNQPLFDSSGNLIPTKANNGRFKFVFSDANGNRSSISANFTSAKVVSNPIDTGLAGYWPLQEGSGETAYDQSGLGHHGTLVNDLVWNGQQLLFPGQEQYIDIGLLDVSGQALTLSAWVKSDDFANCRYHGCRIITKSFNTSNDAQYWMVSTVLIDNQTHLRFSLKTNGTTSNLYASMDDLQEDKWFQVAAVYDGHHMYLYKDGVEVGRMAKTGFIDTNNTVPVWIGGNPYYAHTRPWKGSIADVRVYPKALTANEVNMLKQSFKAPATAVANPIDAGLIAYWPLQEGSGVTAYDHSGHGHDGTLVNGLKWFGNELFFPGKYQYIDVGAFNVTGQALTLSAWVNSSDFSNCRYNGCRIITKSYNTSNDAQYWLINTILIDNKTHLRFSLKTNGQTSHLYADMDDLQENEWFHIAAVYDGSHMYLYKNGVEVGHMPKNGNINADSNVPVWIGGNPYFAHTRPWKGNIADVRVYQRALTVDEIDTLRHQTTPRVTYRYQGEIIRVDGILQDTFAIGERFSGTYTFDPRTQPVADHRFPPVSGIFNGAIKAATFESDYYQSSSDSGRIDQVFTDVQAQSPFFKAVNRYTATVPLQYQLQLGDYIPTQIELSWVIQDDGRWDYLHNELNPRKLLTYPRFDPTVPAYWVLPNEWLLDANDKDVYSPKQGIVGDTNQPLYDEGRTLAVNGDFSLEFRKNVGGGYYMQAFVKGKIRSITPVNISSSEQDLSLVAHWPMTDASDPVIDVSGNEHFGTLHGAMYSPNGLRFDGVDDYVDTGYFDVYGAITLAAWAKADDLENCTNNACTIIAKYNLGNYWQLSTVKVGQQTRLSFALDALTPGKVGTTLIASSGQLSEGELFHVAGVYDGTTMRLYKDGVEIGRTTKVGQIDNDDHWRNSGRFSYLAPVWIGAKPRNPTSNPWKGEIGDVRIYNRALTEADIRMIIQQQ